MVYAFYKFSRHFSEVLLTRKYSNNGYALRKSLYVHIHRRERCREIERFFFSWTTSFPIQSHRYNPLHWIQGWMKLGGKGEKNRLIRPPTTSISLIRFELLYPFILISSGLFRRPCSHGQILQPAQQILSKGQPNIKNTGSKGARKPDRFYH